ncbi:MAG: hypothetical protein KDA44_01535 [Planctomycetales bacterium]|nr:hypothetical protein [Planctomycetales bacterium]
MSHRDSENLRCLVCDAVEITLVDAGHADWVAYFFCAEVSRRSRIIAGLLVDAILNNEPPHRSANFFFLRPTNTIVRRFSLFQFAICFPLVVGVLMWAYRVRIDSARADAIEYFNRAVSEGAPIYAVSELDSAFDDSRVIEIIAGAAKTTDTLVHDGQFRVAQIEPSKFAEGWQSSDELLLYSIDAGSGIYVWNGPEGTRINAVAFSDNALHVTLFGKLQLGSWEYDIPEAAAESYVIKWERRERPPLGSLGNLILARHADELTVRNGR